MTSQLEGINLNTPDNAFGDKHTLTFILRSKKGDDFIVTLPDIARLVYLQLLAPPEALITFDNSAYGKLTVVLHSWMDQDKLNLVTAFRKRDGLMTKPFKEIIPQKKINIYSAPASLSNQSIKENLEKFGEVHDVKNNTTDDDPITSMMDREVHMVVLLPIPSCIKWVKFSIISIGFGI